MGANSKSFKKGELPKVGKQFSSEYQPDKELWTEDEALRLMSDLIDWYGKNQTNIFFEEFLFDNPNLGERPGLIYEQLICYLVEKFPSCLNYYNRAKKIQEVRLMKYAAHDKINAGMSKFLLSAKHGLREKSDVTTDGEKIQTVDPFATMRENHAINSETKEST